MTERFWTKDLCIASAAPFTTRTAWQKARAGAYDAASREGWREDCCAHMPVKKVPDGWWTLERCKADAAKYDSVIAWAKGGGSAYVTANKKGWLPACTAHMSLNRVLRNTWSLETCRDAALQFSCRSDWCKAMPGCYDAATDNGWLDACCGHMESKSQWDNKSNFLYLIELDTPVGVYLKIGRTVDIKERIKQYKLPEGSLANIIKYVHIGDTHATHKTESALKRKISSYKVYSQVLKPIMASGFTECYSTAALSHVLEFMRAPRPVSYQ